MNRDIRVWDYIFPFDTSFKQSNEDRRLPQLILGGLQQIKRITQIVYDNETKEYEYHIEEKFPEMGLETSHRNMKHYVQFMQGLADTRSYEFSKCLEALDQKRVSKIANIGIFLLVSCKKLI